MAFVSVSCINLRSVSLFNVPHKSGGFLVFLLSHQCSGAKLCGRFSDVFNVTKSVSFAFIGAPTFPHDISGFVCDCMQVCLCTN